MAQNTPRPDLDEVLRELAEIGVILTPQQLRALGARVVTTTTAAVQTPESTPTATSVKSSEAEGPTTAGTAQTPGTAPVLACPRCGLPLCLMRAEPEEALCYVVFVGRKVGVFNTSEEADRQILHVSGGKSVRYKNRELAEEAFNAAKTGKRVFVRFSKEEQDAMTAAAAEQNEV